MGMGMVPGVPIEHLPQYEPKARRRKLKKVALVIPHSNEIPAVMPLRNALAKRLMAEGIEITTRTETSMMKQGWEVRRRLDEYVYGVMEERSGWFLDSERNWRERELMNKLTAFQPQAVTLILSMHDYLARIKTIAECLKNGNDLVLELHAMTRNALFGAEDAKIGFSVLGGTNMVIVQNAIRIMDAAFSKHCKDLMEGDEELGEAILKVLELNQAAGLKVSAKKFFRLADQLERQGSRTMIVEVPSVWTDMPAGHPMRSKYSWVSRSDFETAYCAVVRKPVALLAEDVEQMAKAIGAVKE